MAVSPADFRLWASATGNNYPNSAAERAALTPEVFNFAKNYAKELGEKEKGKRSS